MPDFVQIAYPACLTANRVPAGRVGEDPTCGKCGTSLLPGAPAELGEEQCRAMARAIPTVALFMNGAEVKRVAGAVDAPTLVGWLQG